MDFDKLVASVRPPAHLYALINRQTLRTVQLAASDTRPTITTAKTAFARVSQMLSLRNAVKSLPLLRDALAGSKSQILRIIHDVRPSYASLYLAVVGSDGTFGFGSKYRTNGSRRWSAWLGRA